MSVNPLDSIRAVVLSSQSRARRILERLSAEVLNDPTYAFAAFSDPYAAAWESRVAAEWLQAMDGLNEPGFVAWAASEAERVVATASRLQPSDHARIYDVAARARLVNDCRRHLDRLAETK